MIDRLCNCGSGLPAEELFDARGIYVASVCGKCEKTVKSKYRPEIFEDCGYSCDEPIEPEEY